MPSNKINVLRKHLCQCNAEHRWSVQNVDLAVVIDGGSDLVEADNTAVKSYVKAGPNELSSV